MPKSFRFRIRDANGETPDIEGAFSDAEWELLNRFACLVDELTEIPLAKRGLDYGISLAWDAQRGWAPVDLNRLPSNTELREFLHVLRPIILEGEPTYLVKILNILSRKAPHASWKKLRARFDGSLFVRMLRIEMTLAVDQKAIVLNSERTLKKWLNAFEYHRDPDLAAEFHEIHAGDFPTPAHTKGLMLEVLREKTIAAVQLRELIRTFETGKGASFTVR